MYVSLGINFQSSKVEAASFRSSYSLLDYEGVIWDPDAVLAEYQRNPISAWYLGRPNLSDHDSIHFCDDARRRKNELAEMLAMGRPLIMFTPTASSFYVHTGEVRTSGTGRNAQRTRIVNETSVAAAFPIEVATTDAVGENIDVRGPDAFRRFWERNRDHLYYRAVIDGSIGEPVFFVSGTERTVGGVSRVGSGFCVLLPSLNIPENYSRQRRGAIERRFVDSLLELVAELSASPEDVPLPSWTERFLVPGENDALSELARLEAQQTKLHVRVDKAQSELDRLRSYKAVLTSSGPALEHLVQSIFEELGCSVQLGAPGRDDLIVTHGVATAVVEVKGVSKSAAEKHAAQLEKWVSEHFAAHGVQPKGILVVNAFRDLPLDERTDPAFPAQMLPYSERREHCLITTGQLLGLLFQARREPHQRSAMLDALFSTVGLYRDHADWRECISHLSKQP